MHLPQEQQVQVFISQYVKVQIIIGIIYRQQLTQKSIIIIQWWCFVNSDIVIEIIYYILQLIILFKSYTYLKIPMSNAYINAVNFRIRCHVEWGQALYIVLYFKKSSIAWQPYRLTCIQLDDQKDVWETGFMELDQDQTDKNHDQYWNQEIICRFFVGGYQNQQSNKRFVLWEHSQDQMTRKFSRNLYKEKCVTIFYQNNQRRSCIDDQGNISYQINENNFNIFPMNQKLIRVNMCIKKKVDHGRWIYAMPLPDKLSEKQKQQKIQEQSKMMDKKREVFRQEDYLKAVKLQRIATKNRGTYYWKINWVFTLSQFQKQNGSMNIALFQSFFYQRLKKSWVGVLQGKNQERPLDQIINELNSSDIPFQIQVVDQETGQLIEGFSRNTQDLVKQKFIYQTTDDIQADKVFQVFVISTKFPKNKMKRNPKKPKFWQAQIFMCKQDIKELDYYFDVNVLEQLQYRNLKTNRFVFKDASSNSRVYEIHEKGNIFSSSNYSPNRSACNNCHNISNQTYVSNTNQSNYWNGPDRTSTHHVSMSNYYTCPHNTYVVHQNNTRYYTGGSGMSNWKSYTSWANGSYATPYNYRTANSMGCAAGGSQGTSDGSGGSGTGVRSRGTNAQSNSETNAVSYGGTSCGNNAGSNRGSSWGSSGGTSAGGNGGNTGNSWGSNSGSNGRNNYYGTNRMGNRYKNYYNKQNSSSNYRNSTNRIARFTQNSVYYKKGQSNPTTKILNNIINYEINKINYQARLKQFLDKPQQELRNIRVRDYVVPVKLKLVKKTQIQLVEDTFKRQSEQLAKLYDIPGGISDDFSQIKELRTKLLKEQLNNIIQSQEEIQRLQRNRKMLFTLQMMAMSKKWGCSKYSQACQQNICNIMHAYKLLQKDNEGKIGYQSDVIYSIMYYLNQKVTKTHMYNQIACNSSCPKCGKQKEFQDKLQNTLNFIRNSYNLSIVPQQRIRELQIYQYLQDSIIGDYQHIMEYAKKKNVVLINSPDSATECLMRTLINYAIIYSLGSNKFGKEKVNGFKNDCGPFASFTLQLGSYNQTFEWKKLDILIGFAKKQLLVSSTQEQLIQLQDKLLQKVEKTTNKQLIDLVNITLELDKVKQKFSETNAKQLIVSSFINMQGEDDQQDKLMNQVQQIDNIQDQEQRFGRIRSFRQHMFKKTGFKFV